MLKIKDGVDLKELEKFGFKPRYDEYTGKQKVYKKFLVNDCETKALTLTVDTLEFYNDENCNNNKNRYYKFVTLDGDLTFKNSNMLMELLYDLIKAGYVEKVEE